MTSEEQTDMTATCTPGNHTGYTFEEEERELVDGQEVVQHVHRCACGNTVQVKKV